MTILYVADPQKSAQFYQDLMGLQVVESQPTFAIAVQPGQLKLGFWKLEGVQPPAEAGKGGSELAFAVAAGEVDAFYKRANANRIEVAQGPVQLDFGYNCVLLDPDGHRLRLYTPAGV